MKSDEDMSTTRFTTASYTVEQVQKMKREAQPYLIAGSAATLWCAFVVWDMWRQHRFLAAIVAFIGIPWGVFLVTAYSSYLNRRMNEALARKESHV